MSHISIFIELTRLKKPIGFMLLFWPCIWGLSLSYNFSSDLNLYFFYSFLFFLGSVLMRSAGCIVNDIVDKDFDKNVERTKNRPLASESISVKLALIYATLLCFLAFLVLINFNFKTILLAIASMPLAFSYPLMKRFTYWPQLFLGITFNYGIVLGWTSVNSDISLAIIMFYFGAIFWTLGYDTIYGFQDIVDDEVIGLKSTSIKFKHNPKLFLSVCYFLVIICFLVSGLILNLNKFYFMGLIFLTLHLFYFQILKLDRLNFDGCLQIFKSNNTFGIITLITILLGRI